jgi:hypothetical protein
MLTSFGGQNKIKIALTRTAGFIERQKQNSPIKEVDEDEDKKL